MSISNDCLVSIIVPVYNQENYLDKCFESILSQTYKNLELIAVNDGSTDKSITIIEKWAQKDSRVHLIQKANGGLSDARNCGLQEARGTYLFFVDADDWLEPDAVRVTVDAIQKENADMVIFGFYKNYPNGRETTDSIDRYEYCVMEREELFRQLLQDDRVTFHAWRRMYQRVLVQQSVFPVGHNYEDAYAVPILSMPCKKTVYMGKPLYHYRQNPQGIASTFTFQNKLDYLRSFEHSFQLIESAFPALKKEMALSREKHAMVAWDNYLVVDLNNNEQERIILDRIIEMIDKVPAEYLDLKMRFVNRIVKMNLPKPVGRLIYRELVLRDYHHLMRKLIRRLRRNGI